MDVWDLLEDQFPFEEALRQVQELNQRFGLNGDVAFSDKLTPSFFVGDLGNEPRVLLIGLKPGLNSDSNVAFQRERENLRGTFAQYQESRVKYFLSPALNENHYRPSAKAVATLLGQQFPNPIGRYLHANAVQAELVPFFTPHAGLNAVEFRRLCQESLGGQLAGVVLAELLRARPWEALVVRYKLAFDVFCGLQGITAEGHRAQLTVAGRTIPVHGLVGQYVSDSQILDLAREVPSSPRSNQGAGGRAAPDTVSSVSGPTSPADGFRELDLYVCSLGLDVSPLPQRANGSFVFRRGRNFVTLIPQGRGLKMDVFTGTTWRNGVRVLPQGIGINEAKRLIKNAYDLAR